MRSRRCLPNLLGGSADLTHSNLTRAKTHRPVRHDFFEGNYIHYGVREHAMAAAMNGIALHGGFIPYGGTFLTFADYSRPAIRLAALMGVRVIHVMTHDSIGLGEDGPTHQPVEHLASLRAIPNLLVFRPGDAIETAEAWDCALRAEGESVGAVPVAAGAADVSRRDRRHQSGRVRRLCRRRTGGRPRRHPDRNRLRSVDRARRPPRLLEKDNVRAAVVSAPCFELFRRQSARLPRRGSRDASRRIGVEAAIEGDWARWLGDDGEFVGMTGFGASAPAETLYREFGITAEAVATKAAARLARSKIAATHS